MFQGIKFFPREELEKQRVRRTDSDEERRKRKEKRKERHHSKRSRKSRSKRKRDYLSDGEEEKLKSRSSRSKRRQRWETSSSSSFSGSKSDSDDSERQIKKFKNKNSGSSYPSSVEVQEPVGKIEDVELARKELGLEWMLRPSEVASKPVAREDTPDLEERAEQERPKENPRELNPYMKNGGSGYPEENGSVAERETAGDLSALPVVGDGGVSWRLKALKRAKEQAAREGRQLDDVVEERWGSLAQVTASVVSNRGASFSAHLHAIKGRKRGYKGDEGRLGDKNREGGPDRNRHVNRDYLKDVSVRESRMRAPRVNDSLSWKNKRKDSFSHPENDDIIRTAVSSLNKFSNDGSFLEQFKDSSKEKHLGSSTELCTEATALESKMDEHMSEKEDRLSAFVSYKEDASNNNSEAMPSSSSIASTAQGLSANQLAAKAMQLRMKGRHEEAEQLLKEAPNVSKPEDVSKAKVSGQTAFMNYDRGHHGPTYRKKTEDDVDAHLASRIISNRQYSSINQADDEYDYDDIPGSKVQNKRSKQRIKERDDSFNVQRHIVTQQERCNFCFDNPSRPKHLTVAIANFTYLMLPAWEPVVPGHCCILPMQHEASTRNLDDSEWEEVRNFKKCLLKMYAQEIKDVIFLETAMGFSQQRRHCLIDCIPVPSDIAKEAPLYFKQAIDEAEEEWSQHNAKKLIDTSIKGLRGSIPKNFPYFHVEFGMSKGFVHVIDDEKNFKNQFGLNVIRGMLEVQEEDMYRRRRKWSFEMQKACVAEFLKKWETHDWTKMLD